MALVYRKTTGRISLINCFCPDKKAVKLREI